MRNRLTALLLMGITWMLASLPAHAASEWDTYKSRFLMSDGRIIDTGNNSVSHTEGQGFAMMMAVENNDRASFDKIWGWTNATLRNPKNGLFYWRYNPVEPDPIADKNNATDGDTFIAWALLKAGQKWHSNDYLKASDAITKALVTHNVIQFAGKRVMLPGVDGFNLHSSVTLNPSYFIFPAWQDFAQRSHLAVWKQLIADGKTLLGKMRWGNGQLPTDWVSLAADGSMKPAPDKPPRFSYDAIRVPLYLAWYNPASPELVPFKTFWSRYPRMQTPAWVNVVNNEPAPYMMQGGLLAVRDLTLGDSSQPLSLTPQDDYYSASLKMLVIMAKQ